ncbi:hypothetical protein [Chitinilyticum piscinae]|uniref:Uncharacterized protein n=1 Tax=Chitinilyticum piscinae TaxID=2866724 RepID=A0A8J7KCL3_9NEIS|nr:hypothetical protein [Chitinilyticum piscinae]MBE9607899.1 hypothetical protein [Chitinilyticum piscinae]
MSDPLNTAAIETVTGLLLQLLPGFWSLLWAGLLGAFGGLLLALLICVLLFRKNALQRQPLFWNLLAKLAYPLLLAQGVISGLLLGVLLQLQVNCNRFVDDTLGPVTAEHTHALVSYTARQLQQHGSDIDQLTRGMLQGWTLPQGSNWWDTQRAAWLNGFLEGSGRQLLHGVLSEWLAMPLAELPLDAQSRNELAAAGSNSVVQILQSGGDTRSLQALESQLPRTITRSAHGLIDQWFAGHYTLLASSNLILLALLLGEMLLYFHLYLPHRRQAVPQP